ncbi:hypothetical protein, partial [Neisseria sicca]|uniref:hypothetical protein n=1 Tax=Neisseria sicca TaxID=490 RepID=UPI001C99806B
MLFALCDVGVGDSVEGKLGVGERGGKVFKKVVEVGVLEIDKEGLDEEEEGFGVGGKGVDGGLVEDGRGEIMIVGLGEEDGGELNELGEMEMIGRINGGAGEGLIRGMEGGGDLEEDGMGM